MSARGLGLVCVARARARASTHTQLSGPGIASERTWSRRSVPRCEKAVSRDGLDLVRPKVVVPRGLGGSGEGDTSGIC